MSRFDNTDYVYYPRKKLKILQDIFINESKHINEQILEKLKNKEPLLDIIYFTALKRKELAFLQCDEKFNEFGDLRHATDAPLQSPIRESNGQHLIPFISAKIRKNVNNQINEYNIQLQKAREDGNTKLMKSIEQKITKIRPTYQVIFLY